MAFTAEQLASIERQRAHFASDEHIKERAERYRGMTPEECLEDVIDLCELAEIQLAMKSPEVLERVLASEPIPADTIAILEALQRVQR